MNQLISLERRPLRILQILVTFLIACVCAQAQSYIDAAKSAEVDQGRIERARALMAAHQLDTAATELESVRAATKEAALRNISSVMLMNVYLEEGNYTRAEALLEESFNSDANRNEDSLRAYFALAGQAVIGARGHLSRYRTFGINIADANLQSEAAKDLDRLRSFMERMVAHAKTISNTRKAYDSLSLLEDVLGLRLAMAKDSEDQTKWSVEYASVRETLASSQTQVASLGAGPVLVAKTATPNIPKPAPTAVEKAPAPAVMSVTAADNAESNVTSPEQRVSGATAAASSANVSMASTKPIDMGSLNSLATKRIVPQYPQVARQMGMKGMVRVYVVFDENGKVIDIPKSDGPALLRTAAETAARLWIFGSRPTDGRPLRMSGYIDFNFTL